MARRQSQSLSIYALVIRLPFQLTSANIPPRRNREDVRSYRARNLVDWFLNRSNRCRRVVTRYDRLAANYLVFITGINPNLAQHS